MLLTLIWLTIGTSFVSLEQADNKFKAGNCVLEHPQDHSEDTDCPFDTSEETPETCNNFAEVEYLKEQYEPISADACFLKHGKSRYSGEFIFFHVECFSPPPDPGYWS